jgi:O-acetyl-ADP-ribose deacetylase (regulator of RNase III)
MHEPLEAILAHGQLDAIVSSDDTRLSMTGTVSAAVRRMAGDGYAGPARRLLPLQVGDVAVSGAGRLAARYVFHAITADWERGIRPTERIVRDVAARLFTRGEVLRAHTLAIPVAVSGATSLTPEATTRLIIEALADHVANGTELKLVMFPLVDPKAFETIVREVQIERARAAEQTPAETPARARAKAPTGRFPPLPKWTRPRKLTSKKAAEAPASQKPAAASDDPPPRFMGFDPIDPGVRPVLVGRYVLLEQLGRGSLGIVHLAWDLILRRNLAIRIVRPERVDATGLREAAAVAQGLDHPSIVRVHHYDASDRRGPFLASEYLPWNTGERVIADAGQSLLSVASVIGIGLQLCEALDYAHRQGVLHLDIKPGNVFVDATLERAKLADFGLSGVIAPEERAQRLEHAGTAGYTAPEQWVPGGTSTVATDLYQLAATLWDFLVGTPPKLPFEVPRGLTHERQALLENLKRALVRDSGARPLHAREFQELLSAHVNAI